MKLDGYFYITRSQKRMVAMIAYSVSAVLVFGLRLLSIQNGVSPVDILFILGAVLATTYIFEIGFGFYDELREDLAGPHGVMNLGILATSLFAGVMAAIGFGVAKSTEAAVVAGFGLAIATYGTMRLIMPLEFDAN